MEDWVFGDGTHSALLTFQAVIRCSQAKHTLCLQNLSRVVRNVQCFWHVLLFLASPTEAVTEPCIRMGQRCGPLSPIELRQGSIWGQASRKPPDFGLRPDPHSCVKAMIGLEETGTADADTWAALLGPNAQPLAAAEGAAPAASAAAAPAQPAAASAWESLFAEAQEGAGEPRKT